MIIGYSFFVGDLFHVGHLNQVELGRKHCDFLIIGVLSNDAIISYKCKPIIPLEERIRIFQALKLVDLVVIQNSRNPTETLQKLWSLGIRVNILLHGDDWADVPGRYWIESHGGKLVQPPYYPHQSTTNIIDKIRGRTA